MRDNVAGRGADARSIRARELVHELITAHIYEGIDAFATVCASIVDELMSDPKLLGAYLLEASAYSHTLLSAVASGLDAAQPTETDTVARYHRAMIAAWSGSGSDD